MASAGKGGVISGYTRNLACLTIIGSNIVATVESTASQIGHINLNMKRTGKPGAGKPHAGFDEAGAGNQLTVRLVRHSQRKRGANGLARPTATAFRLDSTEVVGGRSLDGLVLLRLPPSPPKGVSTRGPASLQARPGGA